MGALEQTEPLFDLMDDSVMIRTMRGEINSWNQRATELYGWRKEEAIGRISHDLLRTQFPKPLEEIESELAQKGRWEGKLVHTTREGNRVVVASRWALDFKGQSGVVVEVNAPANETLKDLEVSQKTRNRLAKLANVILSGGALFMIWVSFYYIYHYEWTQQRYFTNSITKLVYYVAPIAMAGILLAALRFKPTHKVNFALVGLSLVASLFGMEGFLELSESPLSGRRMPAMLKLQKYSSDKENDAAQLMKKFGVRIDTRNADEVVASLKKGGVDAVPIIVPGDLFIERQNGDISSALKVGGQEMLPVGGISGKVTVLCNENGNWITYTSDKHGFNNPDRVWQLPSMDLAVLGDSFAHGFCVPPANSFVSLIQRNYPSTLNLGMAGAGPMLELAAFKEYAVSFKPRIVLWFYYEGNDLSDLQKERRTQLLPRYLSGEFTQNLAAIQPEIDRAIMDDVPRMRALEMNRRAGREMNHVGVSNKLWEFIKLSKLREKLAIANAVTVAELDAAEDLKGRNLEVFRDILQQVKEQVGTWGGTLHFVYLPDWSRYSGTEPRISIKQRDAVLALVNELGIPVIDIHTTFQSRKDPVSLFPFREPGHYTEAGHSLVAEHVMRVLTAQLSQSASTP
jgi:PAS domain S-box-containing protein